MEPELADLLRAVELQSRMHGGTPRIAREAGQFLNILVKASNVKNLLEVGVVDGYATLWLAEAASVTGGCITGIEDDVWQYDSAKDLLDRSPHASRIRLLQGEIMELLPVLEGPFDFVLLDANKGEMLHYLHILIEQISSGGLICCDKAMSHAPALVDYLTFVHERPGLESVLVPIGEGIEVTYKSP
ncbi:MAG TPA: class I SAM-dependent methyltransferase [Armatimonadota bacterium]